jgi:transcription elongation factor GreA
VPFDKPTADRHGSQVTSSPAPKPTLTGPDLLRAAGLTIEGPITWGRPAAWSGPGVFVVELPAPAARVSIDPNAIGEWLGRVPELRLAGKRPSVAELQSRLASFWLPDQVILYIGSSRKSVGLRLAGMYKTALGERRPQPAGYWLKTLRDVSHLRVWWSPTEDPELVEDDLIDRFVEIAGALPFAVLATPSGEQRAHGLINPLHDDGSAARPAKKPRPKSRKVIEPPSAIETPTPRRTSARTPAAAATGTVATRPAVAPTHLTAEGLTSLRVELDQLTKHRRPEVIARIKAARELGDLSENADYEAARKEQSFLEGRILQIEQMIKSAVIIESTNEAGTEVVLGSTVVVETDRHGEETFTIVGSAEADAAAGKISFTSPIGRALMGRHAGEMVRVQVPAGAMDFRIVEVR